MKHAFTVDGVEWVAWPSGGGAYGTGNRGLGAVEAIHFGRAEDPDVPVMEALLAAGRFEHLFEAELVALFGTAKKVVAVTDPPRRPPGRRTLSG